jgi:hypothetical protein
MSSCLLCTRISRSMLRAILLNIFSTVLGNEDELKALRPTCQVALRLLRDMGGVIVENQARRRGGRIGTAQRSSACISGENAVWRESLHGGRVRCTLGPSLPKSPKGTQS